MVGEVTSSSTSMIGWTCVDDGGSSGATYFPFLIESLPLLAVSSELLLFVADKSPDEDRPGPGRGLLAEDFT